MNKAMTLRHAFKWDTMYSALPSLGSIIKSMPSPKSLNIDQVNIDGVRQLYVIPDV